MLKFKVTRGKCFFRLKVKMKLGKPGTPQWPTWLKSRPELEIVNKYNSQQKICGRIKVLLKGVVKKGRRDHE